MNDDVDEPLRLPPRPVPPPRPSLPVAAAIVPVVGAVVLWQLTGSPSALWFAALGPLMAAASFVDAVRSSRRSRRRARGKAATDLAQLAVDLEARHDDERRRAWHATPDVAGYADDPTEVWRVVPGRADVIVVGRGEGRSSVRLDGEAETAEARELRGRARMLAEMPITVPLSDGIAVAGPPVWAAAVVRALVLQVCLAHPPGQVRLIGGLSAPLRGGCGDAAVAGGGLALPHADATRGAAVLIGNGDRPIPADVEVPIVQVAEGAPPPPRCAAVLTLDGAGQARLDHAGQSRRVQVEALSHTQAARLAVVLSERAATLGQRVDGAVTLAELPVAPSEGVASLASTVGMSAGEPVALDLVADGPHAVVIGVTGSGKSELLTSWIVGMCRGRSPHEVSFLLVDFKGGRTFDALAPLPHVTGVLTDLDETRAVRAVDSLRAEIRHRERVLEAHGARDIAEAVGKLSRLVIVVDEYAALVAARPELHELFADIAARGRALGMHLILASQRAAGAFRDGVLANAPLRIALRVTDAADSRTVIGDDDAVRLPGGPAARGTALVRRAADNGPQTVRIARCGDDTLAALLAESVGVESARRPWLPPLPDHVSVPEVRGRAFESDRAGSGILLGIADEPEHQRQRVIALTEGSAGFAVVGGAGSGRTTVLRAVAAQAARSMWVPADLERAWDMLLGLDTVPPGTVVLVDDADAIAGRFPADYAAAWTATLERTAREARGRGIALVVSAPRVAGPVGRVIDLLPARAILPLPSRADHVAAGGESADFNADSRPGRGRWGRTLVQFATPGETVAAQTAGTPTSRTESAAPETAGRRRRPSIEAEDERTAPRWHPTATGLSGLILPAGARSDAVAAALEADGFAVRALEDAAASAPRSPDSGPGERGGAVADGTVLIGSPEAWLAQWRLLAEARARGEVVIDAGCAAEYRALTGRRDLPPYAAPGARRAWAVLPDTDVRRVTVPA